MDLVSLGINLAVIAGIIALTQVIKKQDKDGKLARFYVLVPLVLGIVAAVFVTVPLTWQGVGANAIIYAGVASYLYVAKRKLIIGGVPIDAEGSVSAQGQAQAPAGVPTIGAAAPGEPAAQGDPGAGK
jgi:hypothetical protein